MLKYMHEKQKQNVFSVVKISKNVFSVVKISKRSLLHLIFNVVETIGNCKKYLGPVSDKIPVCACYDAQCALCFMCMYLTITVLEGMEILL